MKTDLEVIKNYINKPEIISAINENDWDFVYSNSSFIYTTIPVFTKIILDSGIDLLDKLDFIPNFFASGLDLSKYIKDGILVIPKNIETIDFEAFSKCKGIKKLIISEGVSQLGSQCFMDCKDLKEVYLPSTLNFVAEFPFEGTHDLIIHYNGDEETLKNVVQDGNPIYALCGGFSDSDIIYKE